ncbi:hypothetical protein SRB5_59200 [Streptomyces sp. RB5]|uniref:N-acetyltransferase domain-containing protein n=1 Tax=Streptomyces smaragdinus TaxID=2585196 RepID=A0A7K0CQG8_9ACTN|nr:GNAT family N-acetyltransferase [Streptomyces smaragdinus]MQY15730.1 hypothetical protein [Streptomyces smaragdinus]
MEPITLTTDRLLLRPFTAADTEAVYVACQDPEIPRWTTVPQPYTREHAQIFVTEICAAGWRADTSYNLAVTRRDDGALVGAVGLVRLSLAEPVRTAELGYWTAKEQRGHGYTAEAGDALSTWALRTLGVERLEWLAEAGNEASRAVALRIGFTLEGTLRAQIPRGDTRRDAWIGSLLPSDRGMVAGRQYVPYGR